MVPAPRRLEEYLDLVRAEHGRMQVQTTSVSSAREIGKRLVPRRARGTVRMAATRALARRERARAHALPPGQLLHLGSGGVPKKGWVNIDLVGEPADLTWDLALGIPFADGSARAVVHEHVLEHLSLETGVRMLRECHRVLAPGGVLRVGVPDAGALARSYVGDGALLEAYSPGRPTRMLALQETFYWHRHLTMYDEETLLLALRTAGFPEPYVTPFGGSVLPEAQDTPARELGTLYVEAARQAGDPASPRR